MFKDQNQRTLSFAGYAIIGIAFFLFSLGCVFIFNVSSAEALDTSRHRALHSSLIKQLVFASIGAVLAFFTWRFSLANILRHIDLIFGLICFALLLCFVPGIGLSANGSHRWIGFGGYYLQPSEFAKFIVPLFALTRFHRLCQQKITSWLQVLPHFALVSIALSVIIIEPDNRSTILTASGVVVACFLAHLPAKFWLLPMLVFAICAGTIASQLSYVQRRVEVFLDPGLDTSGKGYQPHQAKIAAGSGGWSGRGFGEGLQKFSYLPEAQNDYIVAIIAEELGFIGIAVLSLLYAVFFILCFWIALWADSPLMQQAVGVILYMIGIQVFINLGVVGGLLPSTGLNLPFVSQGGSSLWACSLALACLVDAASDNKSLLKRQS